MKTVTRPNLTQEELLARGSELIERFCDSNGVPCPEVHLVPSDKWNFDVCAFYRPDIPVNRKWTAPGISVCLPKCTRPCGEAMSRQWSWPGSVIDRTPYGVLAHELGHHCDWLAGEQKGSYFSEYGMNLVKEAGEKPITGYCEILAEHFAESFRLFVTNPTLLSQLRPKTHRLLRERWHPVAANIWRRALLPGCSERVIKSLLNKGAR